MTAVTPTAERTAEWRALLLPALCALVAYGAALWGDFVYDDVHSVSTNEAIRDLANVPRLLTDPTAFSSLPGNGMYRPVLLLSYALDHTVAGVTAWVFKATNLVLHALIAVLLGWLARSWGGSRPAACALACLFAAHPLASEAVNLVSGRSEQLMVLFVLLGLHAHRSAMAGRGAGTVGAALCTALACGSKETGVVLPALMLVQEWLAASSAAPGVSSVRWTRLRAAAVRLVPTVLVVLGYLILRRIMFGQATATVLGRPAGDLLTGHGRDLVTQLATMAVHLPRVLFQTLVPAGLSLDPRVTFHRSFADPGVLLGAAGLAGLTALALRRGRRRPLMVLGTALAWLSSLPWIVLPLNVPLSEHRFCGLLVGIALAAVGVADALAPFLSRRPKASMVATAAATSLVVVFAAGATLRSLDYRDERVLWRAVIAADPGNARAHWALGLAELRVGRPDAARAILARAAALNPSLQSARRAWLEALLEGPETSRAPFLSLALADGLLTEKPSDPYFRILKASALLQAGEQTGDRTYAESAERVALSCLEVAEPKGLVFRMAAAARRQLGDPEGAVAHLDRSVEMGLDHYTVLVERAELLLDLGRRPEAQQDLMRAAHQAPMDPRVRAALQRSYGAGPGR